MHKEMHANVCANGFERIRCARRHIRTRALAALTRAHSALLRGIDEQSGQGTTEYAILVGVLVVIAIVAIVAFRGKLTELWTAISDGINGL